MKLYTLHIHMFAVVMPGTLHIELPWLCPVALPWLARPHCRGYARHAFYSLQHTRMSECKILVVILIVASSLVVILIVPHRCLSLGDLCRQPSYFHHNSQIIYLHLCIVYRRSSPSSSSFAIVTCRHPHLCCIFIISHKSSITKP